MDAALTPLETVTLVDGDARVVIAPARGGMVTRFDVGDTAVLFLDVASLVDPAKNVRGGNPVLFPSPGPLVGERFSRDGKSGSMKQHGFARQQAWTVVAQTAREVTLELAANDATRAQFPWDFTARLRYTLAGTALTVETRIENCPELPRPGRGSGRGHNCDASAMPFALGFHPYFHVPDAEKARSRVDTDATRGFDNVTKAMVDVRGPVDLTPKEVDLHLANHTPHVATLCRGERDRIVVSGDPEFRRWVVWTVAGKDFVCLEPWTAPADALNSGDGLCELAPGASKTLTMTIAREPR